jgi:hypothetical protein
MYTENYKIAERMKKDINGKIFVLQKNQYYQTIHIFQCDLQTQAVSTKIPMAFSTKIEKNP